MKSEKTLRQIKHFKQLLRHAGVGFLFTFVAHHAMAGPEEGMLQAAKVFCITNEEVEESQQYENLRNCRKLLDKIVQEYPSSDLAIRILLQEQIEDIDIKSIDERLASNGEDTRVAKNALQVDESDNASALLSDPSADERSLGLTKADVRELQGRLLVAGFNPRGVDGIIGNGTRGALRAWQSVNGFTPNGFFERGQIAALRQATAGKYEAWLKSTRNSQVRRSSTSRLRNGWYRNSQGLYCRKMKIGFEFCQPSRPPDA